MKWVENIKLQAMVSQKEGPAQFMELEARVRETSDLVEASVYGHVMFHNDQAFHLLRDIDSPYLQSNRLAVKLGQALKGFVLVGHSVWVKKTELRRFSYDQDWDYQVLKRHSGNGLLLLYVP